MRRSPRLIPIRLLRWLERGLALLWPTSVHGLVLEHVLILGVPYNVFQSSLSITLVTAFASCYGIARDQ